MFTGNRLGSSDGNRVDERLEGTDRILHVMTMDMAGGHLWPLVSPTTHHPVKTISPYPLCVFHSVDFDVNGLSPFRGHRHLMPESSASSARECHLAFTNNTAPHLPAASVTAMLQPPLSHIVLLA